MSLIPTGQKSKNYVFYTCNNVQYGVINAQESLANSKENKGYLVFADIRKLSNDGTAKIYKIKYLKKATDKSS